MKVTVCVKRVPSTAARIKIAPSGQAIDEAGVEFVINPYDEFALEEGLRVAEKHGGEVTVLSLGPQGITKELRTCLAMGAAKAVHLVQDVPFRDSLTVAKMLAEELKKDLPDLILFGRQAVDNDCAQVGPMVATLLGIPAVVDVVKLEVETDKATAEREVEGGARETYEVSLPAAITAQKGLNDPRYPNLKGIMAAKKKPIETREPIAVEAAQKITALEMPPERGGGKIVGTGADAVPELLRLLREEAGVI